MKSRINVKDLKKSYGSNQVLKGLTLQIQEGEIFALLGINGAGKTTTLECMEGLRTYESGTIEINGTYGVQLQSSSIPNSMKAYEALTLFAKWQHTVVNQTLLSKLGVEPFIKKQYSQLSTGQKRRLHLALALLGNPDIIFLDEPTAGLDVEGRVSIHSVIKELKALGKTIVLASHDMAEIQDLCDRISILKQGTIVFTGTPDQLSKTNQNHFLLNVHFSEPPILDDILLSQLKQSESNTYSFQTESLEDTLSMIINCCKSQNIVMTDVKVEHTGLEQRFLEISKEGIL